MPGTQLRSRRVPVPTQDPTPQLHPVAPLLVNAPQSDSANAAHALATALQLGTTAFKQHYHDQFLKGTQAAEQGRQLTPDEKKHDAFMAGYERLSAERGLIETRKELEAAYEKNFDKQHGTPTELNQFIDKFFRQRYEGINNGSDLSKVVGPGIAKGLEQIRRELLSKYASDVQQQTQDQIHSDLYEVAQDDYHTHGTLDLNKLHERAYQTLGGPEANKALLSIVGDMAVRNGNPKLLAALPEKWSDGTPGLRSVGRFRDALRNYRVQAEAAKEHHQKLADALEAKHEKELRQHNEASLMGDVLSGHDITARVAELVKSGGLEPDTARTLINFQRSNSTDLSKGHVNDALSQKLEIGLYTGDATVSDVVAAADRIGTGEEGKHEVSRLLALASHVKTVADQRLSTPQYKTYQKELERLLKPEKDAFGNEKPEQLALLAHAMRHYDELVEKGEAPLKARNEILREAHEAKSSTPAASSQQPQVTPDELLQQLEAGKITQAEFTQKLDALESASTR